MSENMHDADMGINLYSMLYIRGLGLFITENLTTLHSSSDRLIDEMASGLGDLKQLRF